MPPRMPASLPNLTHETGTAALDMPEPDEQLAVPVGVEAAEGGRMATFVVIHGAGDVGWHWHLVTAELRERGHGTVAPDLPCDDDSAGLSEDADTVAAAARDRADLVVVAQSLGGFTAP